MEVTTQSGDSFDQQPDKQTSNRRWMLGIPLVFSLLFTSASFAEIMMVLFRMIRYLPACQPRMV
jgi:hypothetical protein